MHYYPFSNQFYYNCSSPFGSAISEMQFKSDTGGGYRYGFNNQEKENELGDYYAFEYRIHDARLGRFLSVTPINLKMFGV
jgi:hypothetical protein